MKDLKQINDVIRKLILRVDCIGRRGTEYWCPRCAKEICFSGMMS